MRPRASLLVMAMAAMALACVLGAQSRDAAPNRLSMTGTATISGTVVVDDASAKPLRRVTVTLTDATGALPARLAVTNDAGRFAVRGLPAGRYSVTANRPPYLTTPYGATRVARPGMVPTGTQIVVADGQNLGGLTIKMARGAVITGLVRDATGLPGVGFSVSASYFQRSPVTGERTLVQYYGSGGGGATTDDRGVYRLFGLPPGEYFVSASSFTRMADVVPTTDADVQHALDLIQRPVSSSSPVSAVPGPRKPTVGYVPVYFPGTPALSNATAITIETGQERSGVDFQIQLIATARIEGTVYSPDRAPAAGVSVRLTSPTAGPMDFVFASSATSDATGHYLLPGVAPGPYSVQARSAASGPLAPGAAMPQILWAAGDVTIQGEDVALDLNLEPALTVSGRIVLDGAAPPPDFSRVRLLLGQITATPGMGAPSVLAAADGTFAIPGVVPGRYRLSASVPGVPSAPGGWVVKSASLADQDALDSTAEIRSGQSVEAVVTLTDRTTEIAGTMSDASGRPAPEYFIIVFPAERTLWGPTSRRIVQTRPAQNGKYTFRNLPPGEYLLAAVTDVEQGQWFDPTFLAQLVDAAAKITLADNEKKTQDIRIR